MAKVTTALFGDIAVLPLQAQVPVRESLEWKTDLMESKNGTQYPLQVRGTPRQRLTYSVPEQALRKQMAFNVQYNALRLLWGVPLWTEAQRLGVVSAGVTALSATVDVYDFRDASLAFLYQDPDNWQVIEISTVGVGVLNLTTATNAFANAWLMPMRRGYIRGDVSKRTNGYSATSEILFEIEDNLAVAEAVPADQFLGDDLYFSTPPLLEGEAMETRITSRADIVDFELGKVTRRAPWTYNRVVRPHRFVCQGPTEIRAFRQWLARRRGRNRRYWEPTFENDLRNMSSGTVNTTILVAKDDYLSWTPAERLHVAFQLDDDSWLARTLSNPASVDTTTMQFTLSSSLGVLASRIKCVSWLGLRRLDSDRVEMNWLGNNVLDCTVNVVEVQP